MRRLLPFLVLLALVVAAAIGGVARSDAAVAAPVPEVALNGLRSVDGGGASTCARTATAQVQCWGRNDVGQLGNGNDDPISLPTTVVGPDGVDPLTGVRQVAVGSDVACALLTSTQVACWGDNLFGQVGDGSATMRTRATLVVGVGGSGQLGQITQITVGGTTACARTAGGEARCWGLGESGQLGNGQAVAYNPTPRVVLNRAGTGPLTGVTQVTAGGSTTCARLATGQARCWGANDHGQLGNGGTAPRTRPVTVRAAAGNGPLTGVTQVVAGSDHTCARLANGQARCWGANAGGTLGNGSDDIDPHPRPVVVRKPSGIGPLTGVAQLALGDLHSCARMTTGRVRCWGFNVFGMVGDGSFTQRDLPVAVRSSSGAGELADITTIGTGNGHTCARSTAAVVRCWGHNDGRQLGDTTDEDRELPVLVVNS